MSEELDLEGWTCPLPLRDQPSIVMGHGGGGRLSGELIEHLFVPAFAGTEHAEVLARLGDAAVFDLGGARLAFSTDSYVVRPRFFPGGDIGSLAVHGTVNDVAMSGATPVAISVGVILEEGLALEELGRIANSMGDAARRAGVSIVTGDTKVVDVGHGDGVYINTAGVGLIPPGVDLGAHQVRAGDVVIVSGEIGAHGIAIMSVREGLAFGSDIVSDSAPLNGLVASMMASGAQIRMMRDPTRGGLGATLNEIARASRIGITIAERAIPVAEEVRAACGFLGLDPTGVANEGKLVAIVAPADVDTLLDAMRAHRLARAATVIGTVVPEHEGVVVVTTGIGGSRVLDVPLTEQLPRIC
ncbi:MAG TPA: hydrogenase expression/formation protein HypE [Acidimicrobiales bacterium]|nr:hydrogenase expression/formation protein HypE [Acidimicrobiales bacterium]